jgi:hypothetical protein
MTSITRTALVIGDLHGALRDEMIKHGIPVHHGKRAFFGYTVLADGTAVWFANLLRREPMALDQARAVGDAAWLRALRDAFVGDDVLADELLGGTDPADLIITGQSETCRSYRCGPMDG